MIETIFVEGNGDIADFHLGKYPVTQAQWVAVMGHNPSYFADCDDCPVENVSWEDTREFIKKLNAASGQTYRLPTEAEWEYAARGGKMSNGYKYAGSNDTDDVAWHRGNSAGKTHPVGQKKSNELGLYDMNGNVWEWCEDLDEEGPYRIIRGGGWFLGPEYCRVTYRDGSGPGYRSSDVGFRLVFVP